jgi:hypothetical protein
MTIINKYEKSYKASFQEGEEKTHYCQQHSVGLHKKR